MCTIINIFNINNINNVNNLLNFLWPCLVVFMVSDFEGMSCNLSTLACVYFGQLQPGYEFVPKFGKIWSNSKLTAFYFNNTLTLSPLKKKQDYPIYSAILTI